MNPAEISAAIERQIERLDELVVEVRDAGRQAAESEGAYKVEYAKARLMIRATAVEKITVDQVGDEATVQCEKIYLAHLITESHLMAVRESCRLAQTKTDALRTLSASFRNAAG